MFFFFFNDTATTEIYTLSLHDALPICTSGDRTKQKSAALAKSVESYLARMGMPKKLYQEIKSSARVLFLDARRLKALGLDGTDPAYEEWLRENNYQQPPQSN